MGGENRRSTSSSELKHDKLCCECLNQMLLYTVLCKSLEPLRISSHFARKMVNRCRDLNVCKLTHVP